ncbi:nucleoside hydrolase [soil metagenome]
MPAHRVPLILDVDTGIDDALAIALAALSDKAELVAVTTVAGNTSIANATRNSLDVLDMLGRSDVPVHRGASRPLARPLQTAPHVHGDNGIGGASLPRSTRQVGKDRGPAAIIRMAHERPGELTVVCVGPLTNVAIALNVEPDLPSLLKSIVVMGGAYFVPGNVTRAAEFNFYCDPESADQVLGTPFPESILIGLDVTQKAGLSRDQFEQASSAETAGVQLLRSTYGHTFSDPTVGGAFIHDALAVSVALDRTLISTERHQVRVMAGLDERGASRIVETASVDIGVVVDRTRFHEELFRVLGVPI